jgi:hypothetical protein
VEKQPCTLDQVTVASPCQASWDDMRGDDRARFCRHCKLNVYNLSDMSRDEAEAFVRHSEGRTCVRFYRRHDGTMLTRDCPVGLRAVRHRFARAAAALAGILVALVGGSLFGGKLSRLAPSGFRTPPQAFARWVTPQPDCELVLGKVIYCGPPRPAPVQATPLEDLPTSEPAETPLPPLTADQLQAIQQRLAQ